MKRVSALFLLAGSLLLPAALAGCNSAGGTSDPPAPDVANRKINVVVTTTMIADLVQQVGGERVDVTALMQPGVDPHQYKASAGDIDKLQKADIVFYNGLHLEGKMTDVFEKMRRRVRTVAVTDKLDLNADLRPAQEGYEGTHDPHVWFDVSLWMKVADRVRDGLASLDPAHAGEYRTRFDRHHAELAALHIEVQKKVDSVPKERRVLITAHDAFFYFGHAYGFEVHGLQGISTVSEPSTKDVEELATLVGQRRIPAIFSESSVPTRNLQAVQQAVKKKFGYDVQLLGIEGRDQLYSDSLGDWNTPDGTYIGMVRHNVDVIANALSR